MLLEICIESDGKLGGSLEMRLQLSMYHHLILFLVVPPTKLAVHVHVCVCGGGSTSVITLYVNLNYVAQLHRIILKFHLSLLVLAMYADSYRL